MRESSFLCLGPHGFHRTVYSERGDPANPRLAVCLHGLTRNGRDFDSLAESLGDAWRVVCPDLVGRGRSDWLEVKEDYGYPLYCADMATLLAHLNADEVDWVGTSLGGLVGMLLAAQPRSPIRRLVLNDIGPFVPEGAVARIAGYVGTDPRFSDESALDAYLREIYAPFGPFTPAQWQGLVRSSVRCTPDGDIGLAYDPGIAVPIKAAPPRDIDLWSAWDAVRCPVLVVRGEQSDVLLPETVRAMRERGPGATVVELAAVGHAPTLMSDDQIRLVRAWLGGE